MQKIYILYENDILKDEITEIHQLISPTLVIVVSKV